MLLTLKVQNLTMECKETTLKNFVNSNMEQEYLIWYVGIFYYYNINMCIVYRKSKQHNGQEHE